MTTDPMLELKNAAWYKEKGQPVFTDVNLVLNEGDVLVLQGKSGSGKSTLLKCISHLNIYEGEVLYRGQKPQHYGIPAFRTRVMYVPQRPSMLPGTPRDFLTTVYTFGVHKSSSASSKAASAVSDALRSSEPDVSQHEAFAIAESWGIQRELWDRSWANLSGGEAQRIVLAIAVGLASAEILLLDGAYQLHSRTFEMVKLTPPLAEPTSALDSESSSKVEKHLTAEVKSPSSKLKSIVWITHSPEQGQRVGTRFIRITSGGVREEGTDPGV